MTHTKHENDEGWCTDKAQGGVKYDQGKPRYDLIDPAALDELAKVLTYGAEKYSARNWERGMHFSRLFGASMRHLWSFWRGEEKDPETGFSHLAHALCCIMMLLGLVNRDEEMEQFDDRPYKGKDI